MRYVLITSDRLKYILNEEENKKVVQAILRNDKAALIQDSVIPLHITPAITPFEVWYAQENERIALTGHRLCKKCLRTMEIQDKCTCWQEQGKGENKNAFKEPVLPESVHEAIKQMADKKNFPQLSEIEKLEVENEEKLLQRPTCNADDKGDYYEDSETGEKTYS